MIITFSGIDGGGKTTQIDKLLKVIKGRRARAVYIWSRGGYTYFFLLLKSIMRKILRKKIPPPGQSHKRTTLFKNKKVSRLWLILSIIDLIRLYAINVRILDLLGRTVVCDRYYMDTLVDFKLNFPQEAVEKWLLWRFMTMVSPKPDISFLFLIPIEESIKRTRLKNEPFSDSRQIQVLRYKIYTEFSISGQYYVLDGLRSQEELSNEIAQKVSPA